MSGTHDGRMWRAYRLHFPHTIAYSLAYAKAKRQHTIDKWTSTEAPTATTLSLVCSTHVPSINSKTYTTLAYILASKHRTREEEKYICAHSTVNHAHATTHTHTHSLHRRYASKWKQRSVVCCGQGATTSVENHFHYQASPFTLRFSLAIVNDAPVWVSISIDTQHTCSATVGGMINFRINFQDSQSE